MRRATDSRQRELKCLKGSTPTIEVSGHYENEKEKRIAMLKKQKHDNTPDGRYFANAQIYEEYKVYDSDSAMAYVDANIALARHEGWDDRLTDWKIRRSFVLAATGLLAESFDELRSLDTRRMGNEQRAEYFAQMTYLYSHQGQYQGMSSRARDFHPHPLTEPCVKVSPHTALHTQLFVHRHNLGV